MSFGVTEGWDGEGTVRIHSLMTRDCCPQCVIMGLSVSDVGFSVSCLM